MKIPLKGLGFNSYYYIYAIIKRLETNCIQEHNHNPADYVVF